MEDTQFLESHLSPVQQVQATKISFTNDSDRLAFELNSNGAFTTVVVFEHCWSHGEKKSWSKYLWNKHLPTRIGFFIWRVMYHGFPMDNKVQEHGSSLASRCYCFSSSQCKTTDHLFCQGELATSMWNHFCNLLQIWIQRDTILHLVKDWFQKASIYTRRNVVNPNWMYHFVAYLVGTK